MDMSMGLMLKNMLRTVSSLTLLALPAFFQPVWAEDFLCDATQASTNQLPVLDKACPIGQGLWGKQKPKSQSSNFWIQCGVLSKPLPLQKAKLFYAHISTDVWLKPEANTYRCLIGPYTDYAQAQKELPLIQKVPGYKEAFIREVQRSNGQAAASVQKPKAPAPVATKKPQAKPKAQPKTLAEVPKAQATAASNMTIRLSATTNGIEYQVPHITSGDDQFYMEHGLAWNRLSYDSAEKTCATLNMRLATEEEWQRLLDSKLMKSDQWPMHLPYWGWGKKGLFTSGKVSQLKGSSLLNVICVK
ncbi:SPOR domain-containing protein [Vibrio aestuarianus]|uniref:SPOR domain-containing protein n=2 Tax=Vibrio aestuarianus TaxID=28171 RepID=UPI0015583AAD|nr:SPOR domain-containing protein [Vibrio aestuarianus]MDE1309795.1 SPOR domain-containing protein [Vibrio aestuarianus]NGZ14079.1 SPOR domain-containing protein [Vibrio aestuarianus]NGZ93683.1 SPOR domain-containing protein [Vibrio aestuarianus subsp. cardii]NKZ50227.1 SPOR domain-containing protein [Vibrio aestuarianus]